jgi:SWI/SNF-related matrix-associated actin-dependent regulator of chromatin subfamily A member 5
MKDRKKLSVHRAAFATAVAPILGPFIPKFQYEPAPVNALRTLVPKLPAGAKQPKGVTGNMREYQKQGIAFLDMCYERGTGAILADEMGLGKTLQTLAWLQKLHERGVDGPYLLVVPLSVFSSWFSEVKRWTPSMRVVRLHTCDEDEKKRVTGLLSDPSSFDICLTTFDMLTSTVARALTSRIVWRAVVLDEGHKIKNSETQVHQACCRIRAVQRVILTGTPLQNNLSELYNLLKFCQPDLFYDGAAFEDAFDLGTEVTCNDDMVSRSHYVLRLFCLRRLKSDVETKMPPKTEIIVKCPLSDMQTFWYKRLLLKNAAALENAMTSGADKEEGSSGADWKRLQSLFMQLRKVSMHPYMLPNAEPDFDGTTNEDIVEASGKMQVLDRLLVGLQAKGHRTIIFSQFTMGMDIIGDYLDMRRHKYCRLDGSTNRVQRMVDIGKFNRPNSDTFIFLLSTRAGGLGVNLQTADTCILFDSDWNPQVDLQAMARVHRIGQTKPVHVYRLLTSGTIEERMLQRAERKLFLDTMVNRDNTKESDDADMKEDVSSGEMLSAMTFGMSNIVSGEGNLVTVPTPEEIIRLIDRTQPPVKEFQKQEMSFEEAREGLSADWKETKVFQGMDYRTHKNKGFKDIASEWVEELAKKKQKKRERESTTVMVGNQAVLKTNMYDLSVGEPSVFHKEAAGGRAMASEAAIKARKPKAQKAGRDYDHMDVCLLCWDGGELLTCDGCPGSYHPKCLGMSVQEARDINFMWRCPHHACQKCDRKAQAVGGLLFRCQNCPAAYCEDCLPNEAMILGECERFQRLGMIHPKQACFIFCSKGCADFDEQATTIFESGQDSADVWVDDSNPKKKSLASPKKAKKSKSKASPTKSAPKKNHPFFSAGMLQMHNQAQKVETVRSSPPFPSFLYFLCVLLTLQPFVTSGLHF